MSAINNLNILIPMAGMGTRFGKTHPNEFKPFININGNPMIERVIENNNQVKNTKFIFITRKEMPIDKLTDICIKSNILFEIITIDYVTEGSACTCLLAKKIINNDIPLVIKNCDQIVDDLNVENILRFSHNKQSDGVVGVFHSNSNKNSYIKLNDHFEITEIREKEVISNIATTGFHFWKRGSLFTESAEAMINENERYNNEFYVGPTYNHLIKKGMKIHPYYFNMHHPVGTPEDLERYLTL